MNAPDPELTVGRRVDLLTTGGRLWGRGQAVGHFDFPSYVVDLEDGRGRTGWAAHLTRLTDELLAPATSPGGVSAELLALAAAAANLSVHLAMVGDTAEQRRFYHVARVEALRDIEARLRQLARGGMSG